MQSRINKIGIEIEGEFAPSLFTELREMNGQMVSDGSVRECSHRVKFHKTHPTTAPLSAAEFNSAPILLEDKKKFKKIFDTLEKAAKEGRFHWNRSAGFHIHLSFRPTVPPEIRSTKFTKYMLDALKAKFPVEYRIRTSGRWCRIDGLDNEEFIKNPTDRYKAINYQAFDKHGTLEFRIFPSKHPHRMYQYFLFTVKTVRAYLEQEHRVASEVSIDTAPASVSATHNA